MSIFLNFVVNVTLLISLDSLL